MRKYNSDWIDRNDYLEKLEDVEDNHPHYVQYYRPVIVCLCGSTRFMKEFYDANMRETLDGKIVLTVGMSSHGDCKPTSEQKVLLDKLHFRKIDLCDEILVLNVGGYIGESTKNELEYARKNGKTIRYLEEPKDATN